MKFCCYFIISSLIKSRNLPSLSHSEENLFSRTNRRGENPWIQIEKKGKSNILQFAVQQPESKPFLFFLNNGYQNSRWQCVPAKFRTETKQCMDHLMHRGWTWSLHVYTITENLQPTPSDTGAISCLTWQNTDSGRHETQLRMWWLTLKTKKPRGPWQLGCTHPHKSYTNDAHRHVCAQRLNGVCGCLAPMLQKCPLKYWYQITPQYAWASVLHKRTLPIFSHGWFTGRRNMFAEMTIKYKNSCTDWVI